MVEEHAWTACVVSRLGNFVIVQPGGPAPAGELRTVELASGNADAVLPGVLVAGYDISPDGREVAFTTPDSGGGSQIWLAPLDRRSSPRQMTGSADQVSFGPQGQLFFRVKEKNTNFLYRVNRDGTGRKRVTSIPILVKYGVSPDAHGWWPWSPRNPMTTTEC